MPRIKIPIQPKYGEKSYPAYVLENYLNLKNGIVHGRGCLCCSDLFRLSTRHEGRRGTLKKEAFFIYWLYADSNKLWTFQSLREGVPAIRKKWDKVLNMLDSLVENLNPETYDKRDAENINRIVRRYKKCGIIEKTLIESCSATLSDLFRNIKGMGIPHVSFIEISDEVLEYIRAQGIVIRSQLRRRSRRFQRMRKDFFDGIIEYLIEKKAINIRIYSGRTFLSANKSGDRERG